MRKDEPEDQMLFVSNDVDISLKMSSVNEHNVNGPRKKVKSNAKKDEEIWFDAEDGLQKTPLTEIWANFYAAILICSRQNSVTSIF